MRPDLDYAQAPYLCIWEATRACQLACRHCRAAAIDRRDPRELDTTEGVALIESVAAMGTPVMVLTGGDPLQRDDLEELIGAGKRAGLRMATIPAATDRCTPERIRSLAAAGVDQLALSLDHPDAAAHDAFRGVPGAFQKAMDAAGWIRDAGVALQVNTVLGPWNDGRLEDLIAMVRALGVSFWEVFFLVPTGRGAELDELDPAAFERAFARLYALASTREFIVKIAEAPHYHRYRLQQRQSAIEHGPAGRRPGTGRPVGRAPKPVNAGRGFCFVDHVGDVTPSGFLPVVAGNVRTTDVATIYRDSELFRALRDADRLQGRCGRCEYRWVCGGSRSRAYAVTGDVLATDPSCGYQPGAVPLETVQALAQA